MDFFKFAQMIDDANTRSINVLCDKAKEYAIDDRDRLSQFKRAATLQNITPTEALIGMASKHMISIADMARDPTRYNRELWQEKITDLRNYTYLLEGLLIDLGVRSIVEELD